MTISFYKTGVLDSIKDFIGEPVVIDGVSSLPFDSIKLEVRDGIAWMVLYYKDKELVSISQGESPIVVISGRLPFSLS